MGRDEGTRGIEKVLMVGAAERFANQMTWNSRD